METLAEAHEVSVRTLRNWKRLDPSAPPRPVGRPRRPAERVDAARREVHAVLLRQGWSVGECTVHHALGGRYSRTLVRDLLRELKAEHRREQAHRRRALRTSCRVLCRDAMWHLDATHLCRVVHGPAIEAEILHEAASTRRIGISVGPKATAEEVVELLDATALERGGPPLVLVIDNAQTYVGELVLRWCAANGVQPLKSLPRTPQHNAPAERGIGELKRELGLAPKRKRPARLTLLPAGVRALTTSLLRAAHRLDHNRIRPSRGWRTAVQHDQALPSWRTRTTRARFLATASCALRTAMLDCPSPHARRRAERAAILGTLERLQLVEITRGAAPPKRSFAEDVS